MSLNYEELHFLDSSFHRQVFCILKHTQENSEVGSSETWADTCFQHSSMSFIE